MGALLFFIGIPVAFAIMGWIIEIFDKQKEDNRQQEITDKARYNLLHKKYLEEKAYKKGLSLVKVEDFRWCYIQKNGLPLNNGQLYFSAEEFDSKTVIVGLVDGGYNIMDTSGHYLLPILCDKNKSYYVKRIIPGFYSVSIRTQVSRDCVSYEYHVYNEDGTRLNTSPLSSEATYSDGWFTINAGGKETKMDKKGKLEAPFFKSREPIGNSLYIVTEDSSYVYGLYDAKKDKMLLPCAYESLFYSKESQTCIVKVRTREGVWKKGQCVVPPEFCYRIITIDGKIIYESQDHFCSIVDSKFILTRKIIENSKPLFGAISFNGTVIFKPSYKKVLVNDSGTLFFALSETHCYVSDKLGRVISTYNFQSDEHGMDDTITIYKHIYPSIYVDNGKGVISKKWTSLSTKDIAIVISSNDGKKGILSLDNEILIPTKYDSFQQIDNENDIPIGVIAKKDGLYGAISLSGETIVPIRYVSLTYDYEDSESYVPLYDISATTNFYEDIEELDNWDNWKAGRTRMLVIKDEGGNVISRHIICGNNCERILSEKSTATEFVTPERSKEKDIQDKKLNTIKYLFFDTETVGLPLNYKAPSSDLTNWPRLVQLSWILIDEEGKRISAGDYIIKPSGFRIPDSSANIHGITTEIAMSRGVDLSVAINKFIDDYNECDALVGHNLSFDKKVVGAEMIRLGRNDVLRRKRSICTMTSSVDFCKIPGKYGYKYPQLQELHKELFGVGFDDAHNSAADVEATLKCFQELKRRGIL